LKLNNFSSKRELLKQLPLSKKIVSGGAIGTDKLGEKFAEDNNIETEIYLPNWNKFGKKAGYIRNKLIIENCDEVIAFWNGKSPGTKLTIDIAKKLNIPVHIIKIE
jgi:hypothetical protein